MDGTLSKLEIVLSTTICSVSTSFATSPKKIEKDTLYYDKKYFFNIAILLSFFKGLF